MKKITALLMIVILMTPANALVEDNKWETLATQPISGAEYRLNEDKIQLIEGGESIPSETVAPTIKTLEDMLNPNRSIDVQATWKGDILYFGDAATLIAVLSGYENTIYTLQWQHSVDGETWADIPGENKTSMTVLVTEENYLNYWRVVVEITDVIELETK